MGLPFYWVRQTMEKINSVLCYYDNAKEDCKAGKDGEKALGQGLQF